MSRDIPVHEPLLGCPGWESLCNAVWPRPGSRDYALHMLARGTLPTPPPTIAVLLGPPGTGKSAVVSILMGIYKAAGSTAVYLDPIENTDALLGDALTVTVFDGILPSQLTGQTVSTLAAPGRLVIVTTSAYPQWGTVPSFTLLPCVGYPDAVHKAYSALAPGWLERECPAIIADLRKRIKL